MRSYSTFTPIPKSTTDLEEAIETFSLKVSTSDVKGLVFGISTTAVTPPHAADSEPLFQSSLLG